ncbi:unnamed protein product [Peniophora sp. CBMAI 1063]|nr:unnamed protein product [Peniophora sp. CBMAI 1063]
MEQEPAHDQPGDMPPAFYEGINLILGRIDVLQQQVGAFGAQVAAQNETVQALADTSNRNGGLLTRIERHLDDFNVTLRHEFRTLYVSVGVWFERLVDKVIEQREVTRDTARDVVAILRRMMLELADNLRGVRA